MRCFPIYDKGQLVIVSLQSTIVDFCSVLCLENTYGWFLCPDVPSILLLFLP